MKNVFIYVKACRKRSLDAQRIRNYLSENNYKIVDNPKIADLIIFVSCAFLDDVTDKCFQKINEFQKYDAELIVAGCLPEIEKKRLSKVFSGKIINTKDLEEIDKLFPDHKKKFSSIDDTNLLYQNIDLSTPSEILSYCINKVKPLNKTSSQIKKHVMENLSQQHSPLFKALTTPSFHIRVSSGCLGNCSYCAIKPAVGPFKSKPLDQILYEQKKGLKQGYTNFILESDDVGAYGADIGSSFPELLKTMSQTPGQYTITIRALSPKWLVKYFEGLVPIFKKKHFKSLGIAMQSTSSRILKLMNRYSDMKKITDVCLRIKTSVPDLAIDAHYILGFPTETEIEFKQTLEFIKQTNFNVGYFIPFSLKKGTRAETIEPKVPEQEINKRVKYAKRYLKNIGYHVLSYKEEECHILLFDKSGK